MPEPASTTIASTSVAAVAVLSLLPGIDPAVVLGSFSGAVVFVLASDDLSAIKKIGFFLPSFFGGILTAGMVAGIISAFLPNAVVVSHGVGALVASSLVVKTLIMILSGDPSKILSAIRGAKP